MTKNELEKVIRHILYESILYESKQTQINKYGKELVNKLLYLDPSKTYKYIESICSYYEEGVDEKEIEDYINKFDTLQNKNILKNKDINQYKTFDQLKQAVDSTSFKTKRSTKKEVYGKPYKTIENDKGTWLVYNPTTKEESILLGKNTKWCTQQKNYNQFDNYYWGKDLDLYYIINKETQDKYQIVIMKDNKIEEIRDSADKLLTPEKFEELTGMDPHQFKFDKTNLNGTHIIKYDNGNIKSIIHYKHGVLDGKYEEYNKYGDIYITCNYKNGKLEGELIFYYSDGHIETKYTYKNDELNGECLKYYLNGNIEEKSYYKNGKLDGEYFEYTEDGKVKEHKLYKNGKVVKNYLKENITKAELKKAIKYILYESKLYESKQNQINKYGKELVDKLLPLDPTKTYKYIDKICQFYKEGINTKEIKDYINKFDELQNKNILKNKDINSYKTFDKLKQAVDSSSFKTKRSTKKEVYGKPYKTINNDKGTWLVYKPTTTEESILLGKNTKWCTQQKNNNMFNNYYIEMNVDFYYIINKETQDKYQIVVMKDNKIEEIRDSTDKLLTPEKFEELTDIDPYQFKFHKNLNGEYVIKDENGNIEEKCNYKNNKLNGECIYYYKNGLIKAKYNYINDEKDGEQFLYYKNGNIMTKCNYKNGRINGEYIEYYKNGNIKEKSNYKNNELNGEYIEYYSNGSIKAKYNYINDKKNGEQFLYYENGNIEKKCNYKNDKLDGEYIEYNDQGKIYYKCNYKNGKLDGEYFEYTEDGKIKAHKLYKNNRLVKNYLKENITKAELRKIFRHILYESKQTQINKYGKDLVNKLLPLDPSKTYKYIEAICSYYNEGINEKEIEDYIDKFDELQYKNIIKNKDINSYKTFNQLKQVVDSSSFTTKRQVKKEVYGKPYKIIKNNKGTWLIYKPTTKEESCLLGKNTKWCTQQKNNNTFSDYYVEENLDFYYIINKETQDKYQVVVMKDNKIEEIRDSADKLLTIKKFKNLTNIDPHQFKFDKKYLNGKYVTRYDNGNIKTITHYKNGIKNGEEISYYKNGSIKTKNNYKNDELDGEQFLYDEDGNIEIKGNYKNGKLEGEYLIYNKGKLIRKLTYRNNFLNGEYEDYYSNGNVKTKRYYKNGSLDGKYEEYYENGNLKLKCYYKDDKLDGEYIEYTEGGKIKEHKLYKNDKVVKDYLKENINSTELKKIIKYILYESKLYESKQTQINKYGKDLVNKLLPLDPSKTYKYIEAICSYYNEGIDETTIKDYINKFDTLQNKNVIKNKDINSYKTFNQLKNIVDNSSFKTKSSTKKEVYGKPYKIIKNNKGTWLVYKPQTEEESCLLGKNTRWCTQQKNNNKFNEYYVERDLDFYYIINNKTQDKYQVVVMKNNEIEEIRDSADELITTDKFKKLTGIDPHQFKFDKTDLNGKYVTKYDNGNIKTITHYKNGKLDGEYEEYYKNGNIKIKCNYKDGKLEGEYKEYFENGNIKSKSNYINDKLNGKCIEYFENGNIFIKCSFKNDKLNGSYFLYYKNNIIHIKSYYKDGKMDGELIVYYENGNISNKGNYKNDKLEGEYFTYTKNGKIKKHELYKNGEVVKDYLNGGGR